MQQNEEKRARIAKEVRSAAGAAKKLAHQLCLQLVEQAFAITPLHPAAKVAVVCCP
jgi:hypothetical protein